MVGFGKKMREKQIPEWQQYYISYKMMKKKVKQYATQAKAGRKEDRQRVLREFSLMLDHQVEKTVLFLLESQGHLAQRLAKLGDERTFAEEQSDTPRMQQLPDAYRAVGNDLLKLLYFVEINATGLRKILKKFDKRFGYRLTGEYVATRSNHPYSQLQQVFKHVGIGAMVATLSRNLAELQSPRNSLSTSFYEAPPSNFQEPVIQLIKAAEDRLTNSTNFLRFLGQHALLDIPSSPQEAVDEDQYHFWSLLLNLANTFLYMVNTYIIVPTADKYALSIGAAPTLCGVIIGSMAVAQLVSSVYFSAWSNTSYLRPLIFSSIMLLMGNVCYAVAYDWKSLTLLLMGRLLCGFGSARAVNRRYISDCVPVKARLKASAAFVSASALGMACGPGLAGLLVLNKKFMGYTFDANTLPGWVMGFGWLLYLVLVWISFKEPVRNFPQPLTTDASTNENDGAPHVVKRNGNEAETGLLQPLLLTSDSKMEKSEEHDQGRASRPAASIVEAYSLLTYPVKVQLLIYFMLKFSIEILLSESSVVTAHYFQWGTKSVSLFLALIGLTVLPINWVVGSYLSNIYEDRQILLTAEVFTCLGVVVSFSYYGLNYTMGQYICGAVLIFVSAEVLEGVNLSLLSKVMSSRLARGTYNGGLLSTEAGTLARVIADVAITLSGSLGAAQLLNVTMLPTLVIGVFALLATLGSYNSLF